ncbi:calmodulin mutant SYNCAM15, partial [Gaertneriomyces semiglobifer]
AFNLFDRDKSGAIDLHELGAVIQSLGMHATEAELRAMIANVDFDNTGTVEFDEFLQMSLDWMAQSNRQDTAEQLHEAFQSMDLDQDGYISTADLKDVMSDLASEDTTAGDGLAVEDLIKEFDLDGDGRLNFDDFNALMNEK